MKVAFPEPQLLPGFQDLAAHHQRRVIKTYKDGVIAGKAKKV
jgi:hypothetical protein